VEVGVERDTPHEIGSEAKQGARHPVRLQDDPVGPGAEESDRQAGKPIPASPVFGIDAPDTGDQRVGQVIDLGKVGFLQEQVSRGDRAFTGRAEAAVECLQLFKKVIERRGERLHASPVPRTVSG
jgi:hypothetical protein